MTPKTFKIKNFGCQMNVYDGERMAEMLAQQGMTAADDALDADLVVLNTCHIREKAAEKAYSDVGRLKREDGSKPMIALAGCSPGQRIVVVGAKSMELMMDLQKRGYFLAASAGNCGLPAAQYDAALVDWRRRPLSALDAAMDWLDGFLGPRAVLVIWLDAQKSAAKDDLRAAVAKRGFVVLQGAEHPCGSALLARRSQAYPMQKAA